VIEVTAEGWSVITDPPVRFVRSRSIRPLPIPERGGSLDGVVRLLNIREPKDILLAQAWLIGLFQPHGSYPVLILGGEQGAAKSTTAGMLKRVVDPSGAPLRSPPRSIKDLMVGAANSHVLAFDNISHVPPWLSDAICRIATGGGLSDRALYTDDEESLLEAKRPVILTGIGEIATRSDLLDRGILLDLPPIPEEKRRTEEDVTRAFEMEHAHALGAILDAVSAGLRNLPNVEPRPWPRMADFAKWVVACAPGIGVPPEAFLKAYAANRAGANAIALDSSAVAGAVIRLVELGTFEGTATDLLRRLEKQESASAGDLEWPRNGKGMTEALKRCAPNLRASGVEIDIQRTARARLIRLSRRDGCDGDDGFSGLLHGTRTGGVNDADDGDDGSAGPSREGGAL
jgi:hypothetical protein